MESRRRSLQTLLEIDNHTKNPIVRKIVFGANSLLERTLLVNQIKQIYNNIPFRNDPYEFLYLALERFNVKFTISKEEIEAIPVSGPVIVVSNHPFGGVDGMILAAALSSARKDIKILANHFLSLVSDLEPLFLPVDVFESRGATKKNIVSMRKALQWLKDGGLLIAFPSGEVSHLDLKKRRVEDPQWSPSVARLVQLSNAQVLPVYFKGRNSAIFQIAGMIHPYLRTAMLPRELIKKRATEIKFKIGQPISHKRLASIKKPVELAEYMKFCTYQLDRAMAKSKDLNGISQKSDLRKRNMMFIVPPRKSSCLCQEIRSFSKEQHLFSSQEFSVYYALASQLPNILHEIGRLREETFRLVGEGTGNPIDLDRFDNLYTHLFVWNHQKNEIVGAYRLGPTDEIVPRYGKKGLYTDALFKFGDAFLMEIGPALEMGRSFVRKEYQKTYSALLLLWKGIGHYVAGHPHYKNLFGAVSISNDYQSYSRRLIAAFLKLNNYSPELAKMIKPRKRFKQKRSEHLNAAIMDQHCKNLDELSSWISRVEGDGKGVPILLKQYIKLGGKVLCFNVDNDFGDVLDGLMLVDLTGTDQNILKRYMGQEGYEQFKNHQSSL